MLRFDYSGTGSSEGAFEEGTLAGWIADALAMIDLIEGPVILVGSSMGAWIALHLALGLTDRVKAVVGIAPAPDFTEWGFTAEEKATLQGDGLLLRPNPYGEPQVTTLAFWLSGQQLRLLDEPMAIDAPVRLIHGDADDVVPVGVAMRLMQSLRSADVQLNILKGGGHRLSEPHEIEAVTRTVAALLEPKT
jgi:pimeloyl-ACP methyl ester carboxylesterase